MTAREAHILAGALNPDGSMVALEYPGLEEHQILPSYPANHPKFKEFYSVMDGAHAWTIGSACRCGVKTEHTHVPDKIYKAWLLYTDELVQACHLAEGKA